MVNLTIHFKKSPSPHVYDHGDRSTGCTSLPFAFANYISFKEHLEHKQWGLVMHRKDFWGPRAPPSGFQKLSFYSISKENSIIIWLSFPKNHHRWAPLFKFEMFFEINVVRRSKRKLLTTRRSIAKATNVRRW